METVTATMAPLVAARGHSLEIALEESLPDVHGDESKVRQILLNLLSNAVRFTPNGGALRVEAVRDGECCRVSVIDNGIGIKEEDQERIFDAFPQGPKGQIGSHSAKADYTEFSHNVCHVCPLHFSDVGLHHLLVPLSHRSQDRPGRCAIALVNLEWQTDKVVFSRAHP